MKQCPLCDPNRWAINSALAFATFDLYPVSLGHMLIVPKRHVASIFYITWTEAKEMYQTIEICKQLLDYQFKPDGYNLGVNSGPAAGQRIPHAHIHLIPRYKGDVEDPRGGVRGVIPDKKIY